MDDISATIKLLEERIEDPHLGLTEEFFLFVSRMTPLINVDLLIKDEKGRTLLSWRDDEYAGTGWHVPGGIIRVKEKMSERVKKVALLEIGRQVQFNPRPLAINEIILERKTRGHFLSLLFDCRLSGSFAPANKGLKETDPGYLKWHKSCPDNLLKNHKIYKPYINNHHFL